MTNEIPTLRDPQDRRLPRISPPCGLVIFGITGDLARKKLLPAIYDLANRGPAGFRGIRARVHRGAHPHRFQRGNLEPAALGPALCLGHLRRSGSLPSPRRDRRRTRPLTRHRRQPRLLSVHSSVVLPGRRQAPVGHRPQQATGSRMATRHHREALRTTSSRHASFPT